MKMKKTSKGMQKNVVSRVAEVDLAEAVKTKSMVEKAEVGAVKAKINGSGSRSSKNLLPLYIL